MGMRLKVKYLSGSILQGHVHVICQKMSAATQHGFLKHVDSHFRAGGQGMKGRGGEGRGGEGRGGEGRGGEGRGGEGRGGEGREGGKERERRGEGRGGEGRARNTKHSEFSPFSKNVPHSAEGQHPVVDCHGGANYGKKTPYRLFLVTPKRITTYKPNLMWGGGGGGGGGMVSYVLLHNNCRVASKAMIAQRCT